MTVVIKRSALRMWLMAMAGIPLLVISLDVLTNRRITNWLRELIFRPEDTQIYEPRDVIWAWAMLLFGVFIVLWGLKELFMPTKVVECRDDGLALSVLGPFRQPALIPWDRIDDVHATRVDDEGEAVSALVIRLLSHRDLPEDLWEARWLDDDEIALFAEDWSHNVETVASEIVEYAVEIARREPRHDVAAIWDAGEEE